MSGIAPFAVGAIHLPIDPTVQMSGSIAQAGGHQLYQVTLDTEGLLVAVAHTSGNNTLLSLENDQGKILIQSEASSPTNPDDRIAQHLPAGTYYLSVSSRTGVGSFVLSTTFTIAMAPGKAIGEGQGAYGVTTADINEDGKSDLILPDYYYNQILINYGLGDGTFQPPVAIPVGQGPTDVLAARLGGDGQLDLVVVDQLSNDLRILKGDGQGGFQVSQVLATRPGPVKVVAGDFSGDGRLDLAVAETGANGVEIFHNQGDGTFVHASFIGGIGGPTALAAANLNGDGRTDLAVASGKSGSLVLLAGIGSDEFVPQPYQLFVGSGCSDVIAANFSSDGRPDLAAVSPDTGMISIFHYDGFVYRLRGSLKAGTRPEALAAADFNGDGRLDLAAANFGSNTVSVFLGNGDDTFRAATSDPTGSGPIGLTAGDLSGDGRPDLVTSDFVGLTVSVLMNNGDGTFHSPPVVPTSAGPENVVVADLTGNRISDLIVADTGLDEVSIFLGRGDGTFRDPIAVPAGSGPEDVTVGDFTGDGIPDLAVADFNSNTLMILKGNGDGTFRPIENLATGDGPAFLKTSNLDGDGHLDLVVADYIGNNIDVFYGRGDGTFSGATSYPVGLGPSGIAISDLNGDGRPDIAVSDSASNNIYIFMETGTRTYAPPISYPAGAQPWKVTAGDFNKDGHPDLIVSDALSSPSSVALLVNTGDGTFRPAVSFGVGGSPFPLAVGDFNGDGNLDVVAGNDASNDLSVLLGGGNGTFSPVLPLIGGTDPYGLAVGDFNGDGHLDIVSANYRSGDLTVYLGQGNGAFQQPETIPIVSPDLPTITADLEGDGVPQVLVANPQAGTITVFNSQGDGTLQLLSTIQVGGSPSGMVVGDFNGDGRPDLAVTDASSGSVLILLGLGDGTFQGPTRYKVGKSPRFPVVADFDRNGTLDIAVANTYSNDVSVLFGRGDGTFRPEQLYPTGVEPVSLNVGYINGDGYLDLGTVNRGSHDVTDLFGLPGGNFVPVRVDLTGISPSAFVDGDLNGNGEPDFLLSDYKAGLIYVVIDPLINGTSHAVPIYVGAGKLLTASADLYHEGKSDLILANPETGVVTILGGWSNGAFKSRSTIFVGLGIAGLSVVDLNADGFPDILITEAGTGEIRTYLSGGNGVFAAPESTVPLPRPAPLVFPRSTPGLSDIINVDNSGHLLARFGRTGAVAEFGAPFNETSGTGIAFRDFALVLTGGVPAVASLDSQRPFVYVQSTVVVGPAGLTVLPLPGVGNYTRMISGDLFGTGLDDLIVINRTLNEIIIFRQTSSGVFHQYGDPIPVGFGPTDVTLASLNPGGLPDLVVANGSSGDVSLLARDSGGGFLDPVTMPAGLDTAGTVLLSDGLKRTSPDQPVGVTSGVFGPSGLADVVVLDRGTDRISILRGLPDDVLAAPCLALTYPTGLAPIQVVAASLGHNGLLDLIVLNQGSHDISIFLNDGHGGFIALPRVDAGDNPSSLAVSDVTGDGVPDLVVCNFNGDVLILSGNGDGTFQPYQRADGTVNLAVGDLTGSGQTDFVLSNTSKDLLTVQSSGSSPSFIQGRGDGLLAPGPVAIADMNGDGISDLIVTNTGGNDVFVYLGLGQSHFAAPQRFFTGTAPVGLTVAEVAGDRDGLLDLVVANSGSNDVTILIGMTKPDGSWTMVPGPRLKAGARPISTTVADVYGDGGEDIVVVNQDSDTLTVLRGLGSGFFDDKDPRTLTTRLSPVQAFVGHFSSSTSPGLVVLNSLSNNMTYYANINAPAATIATGGIDPVAGVMGDFNKDGFSDLAIANNGDSRITLFDGGPSGPSLAQSISLGASTHPTDLVVSGTKEGALQFFVGAEGKDHAIPVSFSSAWMIETTGPSPTDGGLVNSGGLIRSSTGVQFTSGAFNPAFFEETSNVASMQSQESAQVGAQAGNILGALSQAAAMVTTLTQAAQPLFSPSSRTLGWLLDNLVQLAQGQTAEIFPLGKDEMAAVAVLLSTSSVGTPLEEIGMPTLPVPTEDDAPFVAAYIPDDAGTPSPTRLDRFVANLGDSPVDLSREVFVRPGRVPEFGPDWVWHRRSTDAFAITATFNVGPEGSLAARNVDRASDLAIAVDFGPSIDGQDESPLGQVPSLLLQVAVTLAAVVSLPIGIMAGKRFARRILGKLPISRDQSDRREPIPERIKSVGRFGAMWLSSKSRYSHDVAVHGQ